MALYLHSVGVAPELIGYSYRKYLGSLGRQMQQLDPELRREAKLRGRRIAREVGIEKAAAHLVPRPLDPLKQRVAEARRNKLLSWPAETPPCPSCKVKRFNMPKRSWPSRESAERERAKHKDARLVVYPCPVQPGCWHLGHIRRKRAIAAETSITKRKDAMHPNLADALRRGWKIFPLIHTSRFAVSQPLLTHATTSVEQVDWWQAMYPDCEWAVATGQHSGVFALELSVDVGFETLRSLCNKHFDFMDTLQTKTPSWVTLFYQWPDGGFPAYARVPIAPGLRLLQAMHFAMLPSITSGNLRVCQLNSIETTLSAAPAWLLSFLIEQARQTRPAEIIPLASTLRARHSVLLSFEKRDGYWHCRFLAPKNGRDVCRRRRYSSPDKIIAIAERGGAAVNASDHIHLYGGLENGRGSLLLTLTPAQYERLLTV